jgi:uncharacterized protein (TIGR03067 family)
LEAREPVAAKTPATRRRPVPSRRNPIGLAATLEPREILRVRLRRLGVVRQYSALHPHGLDHAGTENVVESTDCVRVVNAVGGFILPGSAWLCHWDRSSGCASLSSPISLASSTAASHVSADVAPSALMRFTLDPIRSPTTIDLRIAFTRGGEPGTILGIYELDGDTLRICASEMDSGLRPAKFAAPTGSKLGLDVYKRIKPQPKDEEPRDDR